VQIILRRHACVGDVVFGFDVDACQLAYDGSAVYATPSAARAFRTGINIADPERSSNAYEKRLAKYATRGFAVGVPGLELERVAPKYKDGVFAWSPGRSLRKLSLTFGGGDTPTYSVGTEDIVGLPKLIVLSSLRGATREVRPRHRHLATELAAELAASEGVTCTFIIDLEKLAEYGESEEEVWRRPTPPAPPPLKLNRHKTRRDIISDERSYEGVLLAYGENVVKRPSKLTKVLESCCCDDGTRQLHFVFECLQVSADGDWATLATETDNSTPLATIEDASRHEPGRTLYSEGHQQKLPRLLAFPPSNASGVPNPFARMPAEAWFGDVYS